MTVDNGNHPEPTLAGTVDAFRGLWALFVAIEMGDQETKDSLLEEYDTSALLSGWQVFHGGHRNWRSGQATW